MTETLEGGHDTESTHAVGIRRLTSAVGHERVRITSVVDATTDSSTVSCGAVVGSDEHINGHSEQR